MTQPTTTTTPPSAGVTKPGESQRMRNTFRVRRPCSANDKFSTAVVRNCRLYGIVLVLTPFLVQPTAAQESAINATTPAQVHVSVGTFRQELEALRFIMGRPENQQPEIDVRGAAPREVYFQALTMFQKANRLCFEHTRLRVTPPPLPTGEITPGDVNDVVIAALQCLRRVHGEYGLITESVPPARDDKKQPSDVFISIVQANRQLNLMLDRQFAPSDVFEQVTRAVGYTSRLLESFPGSTPIAESPPLQEGKRPADVYRRLLDCVERIRVIAELSGLDMLELSIHDSQVVRAEPSDVFDVATLAVAELAYLHGQLPEAKPTREVYYVGRKFPSAVFQRAGILEAQLNELEQLVRENPDWLNTESSGK